MTGKKIAYLLLGCICLLLGAWAAMTAIRFGLSLKEFSYWDVADIIRFLLVAIYFFWAGARSLRHASEEVPKPRIGWGKLLLGSILIYVEIKQQLLPASNRYHADNEAQTAGMLFARILLYLAGVALIIAAFWRKKSRQLKNAGSTDQLREGTFPS